MKSWRRVSFDPLLPFRVPAILPPIDLTADIRQPPESLLLNCVIVREALAKGEIEPFNAIEEQMVPMLRGKAKPKFEPPKSWLKFVQNSPEYSGAL